MGKIRSVRPEYFGDDDVSKLTPFGRYLLLGIATLADDQGVFRWKPRAIKRAILPDDDVDIAVLLETLVAADLVRRFEVDGSEFGAVRGWGRHQKPREPRALYPLPPALDRYVRIDEITPPVPRKDRATPTWPSRPRSEAQVDGESAMRSGPRRYDASTAPALRQHDDGMTPTDLHTLSSTEGKGEEGSGGDVTATAAVLPVPLPNPPPGLTWMSTDRWKAEVEALVRHAHAKTRLRRLGVESLVRGAVAGLVLRVGDQPEDDDLPTAEREQRQRLRRDPAFTSTFGPIAAWMDDLVRRASGKPAKYLRAGFEGGPSNFPEVRDV
jgi:hypothetical protein